MIPMKRVLLSITLVFVASLLMSQQKIEHKSQLYKADDGKLYIQKEMPVYLYLSTSADKDAKKVRLESMDSKDFTNPMYFDTEGINTFRSPWKIDTVTKKYVYPKEDIIFEVYADGNPPRTHLKNIGKGYKKDEKVYMSNNFKLDFKTYDALSGIKQVYYSIDGEAFKAFTSPIELNAEKVYEIRFYAVDNVGNEEKIRRQKIVIDKTNPESSIKIDGDRADNVVSGNSAIIVQTTEKGSGLKQIYYRINDQSVKPFKYPIKTSWFSEGEHAISYYAVDNLGNKEEWKTFEFFVDKTPPVIVEEIMGNTFMANGVEYSSGRSKFKITTMDNKAGVKSVHYQIGDNEPQKYTEPFYLKGNSGTLKIRTWAFDKVNNKALAGKSSTKGSAAYVDLAGPDLAYKFHGDFVKNRDTVIISKRTKIQLIAKDSESGLENIAYSIDGGPQTKFTENFNIEKQGFHKIYFTGYDKVGNTNQTEFFFMVDNTSPRININFSVEPIGSKTALDNKIYVYPDHLQLFLSATDNLAGLNNIYYKINDGKEYIYSAPLKDFEGGRDYEIHVKVEDKLGNKKEESFKFSIN